MTTASPPSALPAPSQRQRFIPGWLWLLVLAFLAIRVALAWATQLAPDEAVYWSWSRHLACGYLDHPPMVAWLIRLSTVIVGQNELGVRLFSVLLGTGSLVLLLLLGSHYLASRRAVACLGFILLSSPLLAGFSLLATPDTSSTFFSLASLGCVALIFLPGDQEPSGRRDALSWIWAGVLCGLAMVAKYTAVLLPASIGLALLSSAPGRRQLRTPWPWISGVLALAVFSPVVLWNQHHDWVSFRFQLHHGLAIAPPPTFLAGLRKAAISVAAYIGGQFLIWTPLLFPIGIVVLLHFWRRFAALRPVDRLLLWAATFPLLFFAYAATRSKGEINWPSFAYLPLSLLTIRWLEETWDRRRVALVRNGCVVALIGLVVLQLVTPLGSNPVPRWFGRMLPVRLRRPVMAKLDELTGWRELGRRVGVANRDGRPVACELHQVAGEVAFYAPGQPDAWPAGDGERVYAFSYFDTRPDFHDIPRVLYVGANYKWFARRYGYRVSREEAVEIPLATGGNLSTRLLHLDR